MLPDLPMYLLLGRFLVLFPYLSVFLPLECFMRLSHGRFGRLEVIPLLHSAAGGTGSCEQGSSSHRLDRSLATL